MDATGQYTIANLQVYMLRFIAGMSEDLGIDPTRLCMGLGFEVADLSNPECRLSFRQASAMIRRAIELSPEQGLGLRIGSAETIASIGLVGYAMLTSPTFGDAISLGMKMQNYTGALLDFDAEIDKNGLTLHAICRFHEPDIEMFLVEEAFGSFPKVAQALVGEDFRFNSVELSYPRPAYADQYEQYFKCPVRFGQKRNAVTCDMSWLARPLATYDPLSNRQALEVLQMTVSQEDTGAEFIESIERIVRRDLRNPPTLGQVAAQLCMSDRTLRRRLADSGVSYQAVLDNIRHARALALLSTPRLSIEEIAYEVGFSDSHNFRRAFKRWTGHGPREAR
ncbi:AraC family transcriptional regulator [Paraburkholderia acidicola]|uniref:AraC family transcriptional regulator n=1 Tax=Paraburkholderia acidicola TaxID=1912599 RepID=A0ABV1LTV3_9BURK